MAEWADPIGDLKAAVQRGRETGLGPAPSIYGSCLVPRDEHGNEALGVCMNCGAAMVENPMVPWCPDCEETTDD